jgi:hypothetical protein
MRGNARNLPGSIEKFVWSEFLDKFLWRHFQYSTESLSVPESGLVAVCLPILKLPAILMASGAPDVLSPNFAGRRRIDYFIASSKEFIDGMPRFICALRFIVKRIRCQHPNWGCNSKPSHKEIIQPHLEKATSAESPFSVSCWYFASNSSSESV